jgi:hypothetical protein
MRGTSATVIIVVAALPIRHKIRIHLYLSVQIPSWRRIYFRKNNFVHIFHAPHSVCHLRPLILLGGIYLIISLNSFLRLNFLERIIIIVSKGYIDVI